MKRILFLTVILLIVSALSAFAQNGKSIYQKYSDAENVSAIYISPAMFRLIGKIPELEINDSDVNLAPVVRTLTGMYILNSENQAINASLRGDVDRFIKGGRYELLMEAKDDGETVRMYTVGDSKTIESFVMFVVDGDETTFICLDGQMPREQTEKLILEAAK
ncbi:protein of unknown function [Bacteroidales bacterium WCE2004]|jgi:hypothetical protein|nr:protein of unknown function [Bacteroidales bacterium WCE2004]